MRKLRRRPQNREKQSSKVNEVKEEKQSSSCEKSILVFGENINEHLPETPLFVSSDDDSVTSEDGKASFISIFLLSLLSVIFFLNYCFHRHLSLVAEEDISKLSPNLLLYRASGAHNLPVMCHAFASGADPNWINTEDQNRVALHQAVISVSFTK